MTKHRAENLPRTECPDCNGQSIKNGTQIWKRYQMINRPVLVQRMRCKQCGHCWYYAVQVIDVGYVQQSTFFRESSNSNDVVVGNGGNDKIGNNK